MSVPRRLTVLLSAVLMLALPGAPALAQSAGDQQYSDPLAGTPAKKPAKKQSTSTSTAATSSSSTPSLSPTPQSSAPATAPATTAVAPATTTATTSATPSATGQLPRTGADIWIVALAGLALGLFGIGLRVRTADGRL